VCNINFHAALHYLRKQKLSFSISSDDEWTSAVRKNKQEAAIFSSKYGFGTRILFDGLKKNIRKTTKNILFSGFKI